MMYSVLKKMLRKHELRVTDCRMDVLDYFTKQAKALSFKNLEDEFSNYDRVTLYRTLNSFTEHGVLHRIPDDSGTVIYGVCDDSCSTESHNHDHMHFKCTNCGKVECLSEEHLPVVGIPGYMVENVDMIVNGKCPDCV